MLDQVFPSVLICQYFSAELLAAALLLRNIGLVNLELGLLIINITANSFLIQTTEKDRNLLTERKTNKVEDAQSENKNLN